MSGTQTAIGLRSEPPLNDAPLRADGQHTHAWADYFQETSDRLNGMLAKARLGVVDGSDAKAGDIGEYLTVEGLGVTVPGAGYVNVAVLALTAGDWDVSGAVEFVAGGGVTGFNVLASISTVSAAPSGVLQRIQTAFPAAFNVVINAGGPARLNVTAATDVFLVAGSGFAGGAGVTASGSISARRRR